MANSTLCELECLTAIRVSGMLKIEEPLWQLLKNEEFLLN